MKEVVPFRVVWKKFNEDPSIINKRSFLDLSEEQCKEYRRVCNKITKYTLQQNSSVLSIVKLFEKETINYTALRAFLRLDEKNFSKAIELITEINSKDFEEWVGEKNRISSLTGTDLKIYKIQKLLSELKDMLNERSDKSNH